MADMLEYFQLSDFEALVDEIFVFSMDGVDQKIEGVLIKAELIKSGSCPGSEREPFVLEFKFPAGVNLGQCTFQVETAKVDRLPPMFLVPRGTDEDGWYMIATFN